MFQGSFKSVPKKFLGNFKGIQVRLKSISSSFKGVLRVFERSSTGVPWYLRCFKEVSKKFQECFKKNSRVFQ